VAGETIWDEVKDARNWNEDVILPLEKALTAGRYRGPEGQSCSQRRGAQTLGGVPASPQHRGRAVVFEDIDDYKARINDDGARHRRDLHHGLKNCGPKGYPGMSEVGNMGLPPKVLKKGITDMVRISDARMSGTAYGTVSCTRRRKRPLAGRWPWSGPAT
jgi:L-arabonate dehydrase